VSALLLRSSSLRPRVALHITSCSGEYSMNRHHRLSRHVVIGLASLTFSVLAPVAFAQSAATMGGGSPSSASASGASGSDMGNPAAPANPNDPNAAGSAPTTPPHSTDSGNTPPSTASSSNPSALGNKTSIAGSTANSPKGAENGASGASSSGTNP
jgi:hypothetical protein